ncbi:inversin-like isoform X1 [Strongylocentrotus purpuratus]|uniref:Inversin n=1 Tax=Strongylocentrotus purpuratus TaxID=7668 RepID=A0A7M7PD65_STRPU|nr:inversin-like isoform X1 [Strongylocentrotus purpuratus]
MPASEDLLKMFSCFVKTSGNMKRHNAEVAPLQVASGVKSIPDVKGQVPSHGRGGGVLDSKTSLQREASPTTQIHAAAVNGQKTALQKLLKTYPKEVDQADQFGRTPLMFAVLADRLDCAEVLIKKGANVDAKDNGGRTALHWATYKGVFRLCKLLVSKGAYWREKDNEGQTCLHFATRHKDTRCLALIMKQLLPGEVDEQDNSKRTALHWSASYGNEEAVRMLVKHSSNIGIPDTDGKTPLHWAANAGDSPTAINTVQHILETEPSVVNWQDYEGRTALHLAVANGNAAIVQRLVDFQTPLVKCNISVLDNMFRTPLHWAAVLGHTHMVNMLLDKNANYSCSDSNGATPLHYAAQNNHTETVEVFLQREGITDEPDLEGRSALMWAAGKGADGVIEVMMRYKQDINATDKTGATALHAAAMSGHASTVEVLLQHGAAVDVVDQTKHTPLFRAAEMGHTEVMKTLAKGGAQVKVVDQEGRSPLHWAALGGHTCVCYHLMTHDISPNVQDNAGRTPLQCAAYGGFIRCMTLLLEHGADPNLQDNEGMTALHWACSTGYLDATRLLLDHGAFPNHMELTEDRFTPLDYTLLNDHHEVSQYMVEQGALSITGIRDMAATRIQCRFRGFCVRKTFVERKKLLMKHEQLRKDAAAKKREEQSKKGDNPDSSSTPLSSQSQDRISTSNQEMLPPPQDRTQLQENGWTQENANTNNNNNSAVDASVNLSEGFAPSSETLSRDEDGEKMGVAMNIGPPLLGSGNPCSVPLEEAGDEEGQLRILNERRKVVSKERLRLADMRRKNRAATVIQNKWRNYRQCNTKMMHTVHAVQLRRLLRKDEDVWERQIAACTIQLAWRRFYRRKLLKALGGNKALVHTYDPEIMALRQQLTLQKVYGSTTEAKEWFPGPLERKNRPDYMKYIPSPAAMSYNFAVEQYMPDHHKTMSSGLDHITLQRAVGNGQHDRSMALDEADEAFLCQSHGNLGQSGAPYSYNLND